jgi:hypothetical protein
MTDEAPERIWAVDLVLMGEPWAHIEALPMPWKPVSGKKPVEYRRADAPPTLAEAMRCEEVRALFAKRDDGAFKFLRHDGLCAFIGGYGYCDCGLDAALANLGDTP